MPNAVEQPARMVIAVLIDTLCERWGQLPSAIRGEDAHEIFELLYYRSLREGTSSAGTPPAPKSPPADPFAAIPMIALGGM